MLEQNCSECGVEKLDFLPEELDASDSCDDVTWEKYEYVTIMMKGGKSKKKIQLVKKVTKPGHMFQYFKDQLHTFPAHQFRATWQNNQLKNLLDNLPIDHAVCIHDFSENYRCSDRIEMQSYYFQKISIHVSILYRHAILEYDQVDSSTEEPNIICEQFFVISPDSSHGRHFTLYCQKQISEYLKSISAEIKIMHEFTDGCSSPIQEQKLHG